MLRRAPTLSKRTHSLGTMTADMETQGENDDGGLTGPGAPTPLSALEVSKNERT